MRTPKTRIYVEFSDLQLADLRDLMAFTGAETRRAIFMDALALLRWAAREVSKGRRITATGGGPPREITLPLLEGLRPQVQ